MRSLFGGRTQLDNDFEDELAFHVAMREEKKVSDGLSPATARVEARRELGGIEKWKEALRDVRRPRALENFFADVSLAIRLLRKSPAFTLVALTTLTLAIGANTAVFTLLDTLLLRPLPVPQSDRLTLWRVQRDGGDRSFTSVFSYRLFRDLETNPAFSEVFAFYSRKFQMQAGEGTENIAGMLVSGRYFSALRVAPEKGRWIGPQDDQPNGGKTGSVAVISDQFWKTYFNGDVHVIGRSVTLNHVAFTVAGVMPSNFFGAEVGRRPDVYVPLALEPQMDAPYNLIAMEWRAWWLNVGARLSAGVSLAQANATLRVQSNRILASAPIPDPNRMFKNVKYPGLYVMAETGATGFCNTRLAFGKPFLIMMVLVMLVLCVACLNLTTLLMARSAARERELATRSALGTGRGRAQSLATERLMATLASFFAISALLIMAVGLYGTLAYTAARRTGEIGIRMALGAQRGDIIRLILSENSLIVLGGCVLGLLLSLNCTRFVASFLFGVKASSPEVLAVCSGVLILAGLLASLPPALRATRVDPIQAIRHE